MPRRLLPISEAAGTLRAGQTADLALRSAAFVADPAGHGRRISFILSDESVARDLHTISTAGWQLDNYRANPVVLLSHDDSAPPIARTIEIGAVGSKLLATAEFPDADTYPLGDTIFRLLKGGYMNAASVGWLPLEWRAANDRKRPGGVDFISQEMLEWSVVSVPALPTALVTARSAGIELKPLFDWTERLLDSNNFALIGKAELQKLRKAAKTSASPRAKDSGGYMTETNSPPPAEPATAPSQRNFVALARTLMTRNLLDLADFAYLLMSVERICERIEEEAEREGDGSPIPAKLRAWADDGNRLLLEYAGEETAEQIAGTQDERDPYYWSAAGLETAIARALDARGLMRKGAKFSAETIRCLRDIHGHLGQAHASLGDMLAGADAPPADDPPADDGERAAREAAQRKAEADALKARLKA